MKRVYFYFLFALLFMRLLTAKKNPVDQDKVHSTSKTYSYQDAPFIGGIIKYANEDELIRVICIKFQENECVEFTFVEVTNGKIQPMFKNVYSNDQRELIRNNKAKFDKVIRTLILYRFTVTTMTKNFPYGIFFGILMVPVDTALLPIRVPMLFFKKLKVRRALKTLLNFKKSKTMRVKALEWEQLKYVLENIHSN